MKLTLLTQSLYDKLYRDIRKFRLTFDLPVAVPDSLDDKQDQLHTSLISEELTELAEAKDKVEQADAIVDSVYVLMGRLVHLGATGLEQRLEISYLVDLLLQVANNRGINFVPCWDEVHSSNMSKVCRNEQELQDTIAHYAKQGIAISGSRNGDYLIAKCAQDVVMAGKTVRRGKVLKSVYYRPADLGALVN
ncbi:nucleoside triphosphate pyrophosphohydrolase family protein [Shewanella fodinae]|uniref:Phosphoribosyl-ATP pyrophosphohydrolase n=1 Tax=Shewanella fodinae TaxID=552357 RepID=A0A4R2FMP9_9GAMM|nr:nucleoside triphosphate pyrophosphohydrolase family protein [Shewanella fodinae]TCN90663.1 phosphoribosyl-ATP pyrophosphohydrolase [Shewanella fodinae]